MSIGKALEVINRMVADGVVGTYAISGAVAALNYIEPTVTEDLDILISFEAQPASTLVTLGPIVTYLASKGYAEWRKEGLMIEGWPVQFLPVSDPLDQEALDCAVAVEERFGADGVVKTRVLSAEHLVAIALRTGKPKDFLRICTFLDDQVVDLDRLVQVIATHGLIDAWAAFCRKSGLTDPLAGKSRA